MHMKYAMFLRGVNVGGVKVPMSELTECLEKLGLDDVKTYLQTGNVTLDSHIGEVELKKKAQETLSDQFNYEAFVQVFRLDLLKEIIDNYPLALDESNHRYAILCESQEVIDELMGYQKDLYPSVEQIAAGPSVVYWSVPKGSTLKSEFAKIIAKPKYKASTTNRNLNTLERMIA